MLVPTREVKHFGERVRRARERLGLKQDELARRIGVTQSLISQIEAGKQSKSGFGLALADALHVSARWLQTGAGAMESGVSESMGNYHDRTFARNRHEVELLVRFRQLRPRERIALLRLLGCCTGKNEV